MAAQAASTRAALGELLPFLVRLGLLLPPFGLFPGLTPARVARLLGLQICPGRFPISVTVTAGEADRRDRHCG